MNQKASAEYQKELVLYLPPTSTPDGFHDAIFLIKTRYLVDKFFTGPFQSSTVVLRLEVYFILSFFYNCSQSRLLIKSGEKKSCDHKQTQFFNLFLPREDVPFGFLSGLTFWGHSRAQCKLRVSFWWKSCLPPSGVLGSPSSCPASGFWKLVWRRPQLYTTNEHVMRILSFPVSGTAVALSPPAARHSTLAICWQVHISHCRELK